jgi:two-component system, OmpR family, sensor histidine kinase ChvG
MLSTIPRPWRSLRVLGAALLLVLVLLPALMYSLLAELQARQRGLLIGSVRDAGVAIAAGLEPTLRNLTPDAFGGLDATLGPFAESRRSIMLLFHPAAGARDEQFFLVASVPPLSPNDAAGTQATLAELGVLPALSRSCEGGVPLAERVAGRDGTETMLTSVTGIAGPTGCWAVLIAANSADMLGDIDDRPFWRQPEVQRAIAAYIVMAALILAIFAAVRANLARIRRHALEPAAAGGFASVTTLPEIAPVALAIDAMVLRLRTAAEQMRQAAMDNAHAFKGPIATIRQAVEPLTGATPPLERVQPALATVVSALDRLDGLVRAARQLDSAAADLLEIAEQRVDLCPLLRGLVEEPRVDGVTIAAELDAAVVRGQADAIETVFENLLDNAVGFSPPGGTVRVALAAAEGHAVVTVEDEGPGVPAAQLPHIFERYVTDRRRAPRAADAPHFGIGLWLARQNVRALGGDIVARNRFPGGFSVRVTLPLTGLG